MQEEGYGRGIERSGGEEQIQEKTLLIIVPDLEHPDLQRHQREIYQVCCPGYPETDRLSYLVWQ